MKYKITYCLIGVISILLLTGAEYSTAAELSIEAVPLMTEAFAPQGFYPLYDNTESMIVENLFNIHFLVMITNISEQDVSLFDEWNAWGYFNLYVTLHALSGAEIATLSKQPRSWRRNFPSNHILRPGQSEAWAVCISERIWETNTPIPGEQVGGIQVHFIQINEERPDWPQQLRDAFLPSSLWEGKISSKIYILDELNLTDAREGFSSLPIGNGSLIGAIPFLNKDTQK